MLREKLGTTKCFKTAWGRLVTEEEAFTQVNRQIAAMCANLFQVMRIFEPSRSCARSPAGWAASQVTQATNGRTWQAVLSSLQGTAWKRSWIHVHGILLAASCAI